MPGPTAAVPPEKLPNAFEAWLASKGIPERPKYYQRTLFVVKLMFLTILSCDCVVKNLLLVSPTICSLNFHAVAKRLYLRNEHPMNALKSFIWDNSVFN